MKRAIYILMLLPLCLSCARRLPTVVQDSTRIETRIVHDFIRDTLYFEVPSQAAERTTRDTASHLETEYALSDARITADGLLFHSLQNKPQTKPIPFDKPIERQDSIIYRTHIETQTVEVAVVPKFYKTCTWLFWIIAIITILTIVVKTYLKFSKPL